MKKIIAFLVSLLLAVSLSACKADKTGNTFVSSATASIETEDAKVKVSAEKFPENTVIKTEIVKDTSEVKNVLNKAKSIELYDITASLNDKKVQPSGEVEVSFPIPAQYDAKKHIIEVYYVADDGQTEKIEALVEGGSVTAKLKHFSLYAVVVVEKPKLEFAMLIEGEYKAEVRDGNKYFSSNIIVQFDFVENETWKAFVERNKDKGFEIGKDFYGERDAVYYTYEGVKYEVVTAVNTLSGVALEDTIDELYYACMIPHRESIQGQWTYDVSNKPFMVPGYSQPFTRQGKSIILDTNEMTYIIKYEQMQRTAANSFIRNEEILASGKYTSTDGNTLGATLTLDNGYILKTTRSNSFVATLIIDGKSVTAKTPDRYNFYEFS